MTEGLLPYINSVASVIGGDGKRKVEVNELHVTREAALGQSASKTRTDDDQDVASQDRQVNPQQIATLKTELEEIAKKAVVTESVAFPPVTFADQAKQYVYKGKCLDQYKKEGLKDVLRELNAYRGVSDSSKQKLIELAYEAILHSEDNN